jgi:hypothetical protein
MERRESMAPAESPDSEFRCRIILILRSLVNGILISLARISILFGVLSRAGQIE